MYNSLHVQCIGFVTCLFKVSDTNVCLHPVILILCFVELWGIFPYSQKRKKHSDWPTLSGASNTFCTTVAEELTLPQTSIGDGKSK